MSSPAESSRRLSQELDAAIPELSSISDYDASARWRGEGTWSRKEILGHLIDSACNNHQRFVRAAIDGRFEGPGYEQEKWVTAGGYQSLDWGSLLRIWHGMNLLLVNVLANIPESRGASIVKLDGHEPMTLDFVASDYIRHLKHHLGQILG